MHPSRFAPARASSSVPATGPLYLRKSRGYRAAARPRTAWGPGRLRCVGGRGRDRARGAASIARASRFSLHSRPGRRRRRAPAGGVCRLRRARGGGAAAPVWGRRAIRSRETVSFILTRVSFVRTTTLPMVHTDTQSHQAPITSTPPLAGLPHGVSRMMVVLLLVLGLHLLGEAEPVDPSEHLPHARQPNNERMPCAPW